MNIADFEASGWQDLLASATEKTCADYSTIFTQAANQAREAGETTKFEVLWLLAGLTSMRLDTASSGDNPFFPVMTMTDGRRTMIADDISEDELDLLTNIVNGVIDSEMIARIADVIWVRKRNYQMAIRAIDAYAASARNLKSSKYPLAHTSWRIERAIQLARSINKQDALKTLFSDIEDFLQGLASDEDFLTYLPVAMMELLQKYKYQPAQPNIFIDIAEKGKSLATSSANWRLAREYCEVKARWYDGDNMLHRQAKVAAAETYVKEAEEAANDNPPRHLAAAAMIEDAIEAIRKIGGMQEREDRLLELLNDYGQKALLEMKEVSTTLDLTKVVQVAREQVRGKSFYEALYALMSLGNSPSVSDLKNEAQRLIEDHPFQFLISSRTYNDMGKVVHRREAIDDDPENVLKDQMYQQAARSQEIHALGVIEPATSQIVLEHEIRIADFLPLVYDNPFVPPGQEIIYARGFHAGLMGDYLIAAHLLILQVENSLRYVLQNRGVIPSSVNRKLIQDEFTLEKVIFREELKDVFNEDILFDLKGLLIERAGSNLRNLVAHGLLTNHEFDSARVIYLWWLLLRLWCLPKLDYFRQNNLTNDDSGTE